MKTLIPIIRRIAAGSFLALVLIPNTQAQFKNPIRVNEVPESGTFYSLQNPDIAPLPFDPFPDLPLYTLGDGVYRYDDSKLDYQAIQAESMSRLLSMQAASAPSGADGPTPANFLTDLKFDSTGAVVSWNSQPNIVYQIQCSSNLSDSSWFILDDGYPSHGTNTFWKDVGYWGFVSNPKDDPVRFYKIIGTSNSITPPLVTLTVPAGTLSGTVDLNVTVTSTLPVLAARLYIDGAKVDEIDGTGTFSLDTSEFTNGTHIIFATAENESGYESTDETNSPPLSTGYALSTFSTRTFMNVLNSSLTRPILGPTPIPVTNTFGIAFQGNHPSWTELGPNVNWAGPWNGLNANVTLHGEFTIPRPYGPLRSSWKIGDGFLRGMGHVGNTPKFFRAHNDLAKHDYLRAQQWGGSNIFNTVNFGFLFGHGVNGVTVDYTTGSPPIKDTYFPVWLEGTSYYDWVRLSQFDFGSDDLRWMAILNCNNMTEPNFSDMQNKFRLPVNEKLHLLCGTSSTMYMLSNFGRVFGNALTEGTDGTPMTIVEAWFYAGRVTQGINNPHPGVPVIFRVVGWQNCWSDTIYSWQEPDTSDGILYEEERQVYP